MRIIGVGGFEIAMRCRRWRRCRPGSTHQTQAHISPTTECHGNSRYLQNMETQGIYLQNMNHEKANIQFSSTVFFRSERRSSPHQSSWPTQQPYTLSSARQLKQILYLIIKTWFLVSLRLSLTYPLSEICHLLLFRCFIDVLYRSSLTPSVLCASAWLSRRGGRWWATWTSTTSAPRTSTAPSTRTRQR